MTPQQSALFDRHVHWTRRLTKRWSRARGLRGLDLIFAQGVAQQGLWDAVKKFDATLRIKFMTYASHRIRGTLLDWARSMMPGGGRSKHTRDVRLIQFGDVEGEFPDQKILSGFNQIDLEDSVNRVLGQIPSKKHRDLLEMIYLKNQTGVQISRVWKCSEGWVSQMKLEALELARSGTR